MPRRPDIAEVWRAIEVYLSLAYGGSPPSAVRSRLATLKSVPPAEFYESSAVERDADPNPTRFSIRLGNRVYPHMKLTVDRRPDHAGYLFRADTHDRHIAPAPGSRDYEAFVQLMKQNQELAQAIEREWERQGLPTFKAYLRDDLAKRARASASVAPPGATRAEQGR